MVRVYYRSAQHIHYWAMEIVRHMLPVAMVGIETVIIFAFFAAIRLSTSTDEKLLAVVALSAGIISFIVLKRCIEFATKVTNSSRDFSRYPFLNQGPRFGREDKVFLASCKPLMLKVGDTFTINEESFPTISHDILLGTIINLLVTF